MFHDWSTTRKLIWLALVKGGGGIIKTVSGTSPLSLANAIAHSIVSLTQTGKCSQASTPTPTSPVDIKCNNGALKMLNLANMTEGNIVVGKYINNSGAEQGASSNFYYSPFIPVKASTAYTLKTSRSLNYANFLEYDANKDFTKRTLYGSAGTPAGNTTTHTTDATTAYIRFGSNINGSTLTAADVLAVEWMLTEGSTAMDFVPYGQLSTIGTPEVITVTHADSTTQTAGAENLYAIGSTYADTQDIISGAVTRNTGVLVLNGTEDFLPIEGTILTNCYTLAIPLGDGAMTNRRVVCTHFKSADTLPDSNARQGYALIGNGGNNTPAPLTNKYAVAFGAKTAYPSIDSFKAFLAAQYAAGTPVIVIYPLAEPTTETVTGQPLSTTAGTNTVSWTAEVSGKTMACEYKGTE